MELVIVESPAKAKTIEKYLGRGYKVTASMGHLRDLPKSKMGVDIEHGFEPQYIPVKDKRELINELKEPDREIFIRRHYLLEPVTEIAGHLGMAEKQISNRLYQSKLRLREALKERGIAK